MKKHRIQPALLKYCCAQNLDRQKGETQCISRLSRNCLLCQTFMLPKDSNSPIDSIDLLVGLVESAEPVCSACGIAHHAQIHSIGFIRAEDLALCDKRIGFVCQSEKSAAQKMAKYGSNNLAGYGVSQADLPSRSFD